MTSETVFYTDFSHMCEHARRQYGNFPNLIIWPAAGGRQRLLDQK